MYWYKRDPDAALVGMADLTLEERGAYNTILDLLYSRDGDLPDNDRLICTHLRCRPQVWRRLKQRLEILGKVWTNSGQTHAKRVEKELKTARKRIRKAQFAAKKRWENNDGDHAKAKIRALTPTPTSTLGLDSRLNGDPVGIGGHKSKPRHGAHTKDNTRIWLDRDTPEWNAYVDDYREHHRGKPPPTQWGGSGSWFNLQGEHEKIRDGA